MTEAVAGGILPAYDQRLCEQRVASLEDSLSKLRSTSKPKSKFSFKSSINARPAAPPTTTASTVESSTAADLAKPAAATSTTKITLSNHISKLLTFGDATGLQPAGDTVTPEQSVVITLGGLTGCFVDLTRAAPLSVNALHVQGLKRTVLYAGNVQGSVLLRDCVGCTIIVSAHQFRMHTSSATNVYLGISSNPVVEKCSGIRFGTFPLQAGSGATLEPYSKPEGDSDQLPYMVQDFDWMGTGQSPNWSSIGAAPFQLPINVSNDNLGSVLDELLPKVTPS